MAWDLAGVVCPLLASKNEKRSASSFVVGLGNGYARPHQGI